MRILQLCNKPPLPAVDGGTLAMHAVTQGLMECGGDDVSVRVLAIETEKHPFLEEKLSEEYKSATGIESVFIDTSVKLLPAFFNLFSSASYNVERFYSKAFEQKLEHILDEETFDIVHLESIFVAPYIDTIRRKSKAKIVLRAHNVESDLWKRNAGDESNPLKRKWFLSLSEKLLRYEKQALTKVDALVPITARDAEKFQSMNENASLAIHVLPYAMKFPKRRPLSIPGKNPLTVLHIGAMDWKPNIEGIKWFLEEVWPLVLKEVSGAELHLAGKNMKRDDPQFSATNVFVHGEVDDAMGFMDRYQVMIIPLHSGGGMRVKLLEGFFLGKSIVSTSIGAEGYDVEHGKHLLIADDAAGFAHCVVRVLTEKNSEPLRQLEPMLAGTLAKNGHSYANEHDLCYQAGQLIQFYRSLLI